MPKSLPTLMVAAFFALLAASAGTDFPAAWFAAPPPRGIRILGSITDFFTASLGNMGATIAIVIVGLICTGLAARRAAPDLPVRATGRSSESGPVEVARKRSFGRKTDSALASTAAFTPSAVESLSSSGPKPGWSLRLRSPYATWEGATSWLGGLPSAPQDFAWPLDRDGIPLSFLAQIDLASIRPAEHTAPRPVGLPGQGALLVFVGESHSCHLLTDAELASSSTLQPPVDLPPIRKHGFFGEGNGFTHWPVDPLPFLDRGEDRPAAFAERFARPDDWIANWGIAALEAEVAIEALTIEMEQGASFMGRRAAQPQDSASLRDNHVIASKTRHYTHMRKVGPALMQALIDWRQMALSNPAHEGVDGASLVAIFDRRMEVHDQMVDNYSIKAVLPGNAQAVWEKLISKAGYATRRDAFQGLADEYRSFVDARITDWRRHRLFGIEPEFPNNWEDLRGQDCLISINADTLLQTCSEHEYGMSVWLPTDDMRRGRYDRGQFVRHCAV